MKNVLIVLVLLFSFKGIAQCEDFEFTGFINDTWCHDSSEGLISITALEGTEPYVYEIRNDAGELVNPIDSNEATDLIGGEYSIYIIDALGCELFDTLTVNSPPPLVFADFNSDNGVPGEFCFLSMAASGGTPGYSYEWTMIGDPDFSAMSSSVAVDEAGCYIGTATDGNGCILMSDTTCVGWLSNPIVENDDIAVFYSPLDNAVNFKGANLIQIKLYTVDGRLVMNTSIKGQNKIHFEATESLMIYEILAENGTLYSGRISTVSN